MNRTRKCFPEEYCAALRQYREGAGESALHEAYEAGRQALRDGRGILEIVTAHREATESGDAALRCLSESLAPFEMVLRGAQESNARLRRSLDNVRDVQTQLAAQNEKLKAAHQAVEKERHRYQALFDFAPDGYLVTGFEGAIREANTAAAALLHTPKENLAGQSLLELVEEADRPAVREQLHDFHTGRLDRVEDWQISLKPRNRPAIPVAVTVATEAGAPAVAGLRWLIRDATERKRVETERVRSLADQARVQAAQRFEFLSEASSLLAGSFDVEASLASVGRLALPYIADWCFVNVIEADGRIRQLETAHADPASSGRAKELNEYCLFATRLAKEADAFEHSSIVNDTSEEWWNQAAQDSNHASLLRAFRGRSAMAIPLRSRERLMGLLTFVSGVGRRKYRSSDLALGEDLARRCALALENARLYREVIAERDKAEKASRAKDEFLAILSHELRNPLMPVIGWTRLMKNHELIAQHPTLSEATRSMERSAQTLARLVEDCLDLARISEGKIRMERKPVDLKQIIPASVDAVREMASAKGLTLVHEPVEGSVLLMGDAVRLEQVVMNLLINAVKYTDAGGQIAIRCSQHDGECEVEVSDTGAGIHPAFLEQIFQPFRRGTTSWLTHQSGLGLGLAIARQIVEAHGGRVWAESQGLDCGSTFRVRLPMAAVAAPENVRTLAGVSEIDRRAGVRILLVEDSEDIVFLLQIELEMLGHTVMTALNGISGLNLARAQRPDLIISDLKMPGIDGYELIREVRATPDLCGLPAIALTGFGAKADFDRAIGAGFDACISKPGEPKELSALIGKLTAKQARNAAAHKNS